MKDLSQATIKKIKEEQIRPKAKWKFSVESLLLWMVLAIFVILGALSLSISYYFLSQLDWDMVSLDKHIPSGRILRLLPNFWLLFLAAFFILALIIYRHTKHGYRFGISSVVLLILASIITLGIGTHFLRADRGLNNVLTKHVPGYIYFSNNKEKQWSQPDLGLLGGKISEMKENNFKLKDFQGNDWQVNYGQETFVKPSVKLVPEETVKIIGEKKANQNFQAEEIRPWEGKGIMHGKIENGGCRNKSRRQP